jgi:hypothetical protein
MKTTVLSRYAMCNSMTAAAGTLLGSVKSNKVPSRYAVCNSVTTAAGPVPRFSKEQHSALMLRRV